MVEDADKNPFASPALEAAKKQTYTDWRSRLLHVVLLVESLAIAALLAGGPVPLAGVAALLAATLSTGVAMALLISARRTWVTILDATFYLLMWSTLPCILVQHATGGVGEAVLRFTVAARIFAVVLVWRLARSHYSALTHS